MRLVKIQAASIQRYDKAMVLFFRWLRRCKYAFPSHMSDLDHLAGEFVNSLWQDYQPHSHAANFVSALGRYLPSCKRHIAVTKQYLKNWTGTLSRRRALPLSEVVVRGMIGLAVSQNELRLAVCYALGFTALLRTDEIVTLCPDQIRYTAGARSALQPCLATPSKQAETMPRIQ